MLIQFSDAKIHIKDLQFGTVVELVYDNGKRTFGHIEGFKGDGVLYIAVLVNGQHKNILPEDLMFNIDF